MTEVLLRPQAESDMDELADYTIKRWNREQARSYVTTLRADIARLAEFPDRFPVHEPTGLGLRRMRSGHHFVYYLAGEAMVDVVRILHERRDPTRHLV